MLLNISCVPLGRQPLSTFCAVLFATHAGVPALRGSGSSSSSNGQAELHEIEVDVLNFWLTYRLPLHSRTLRYDEGYRSVEKYGERIKGQVGVIKFQSKNLQSNKPEMDKELPVSQGEGMAALSHVQAENL